MSTLVALWRRPWEVAATSTPAGADEETRERARKALALMKGSGAVLTTPRSVPYGPPGGASILGGGRR